MLGLSADVLAMPRLLPMKNPARLASAALCAAMISATAATAASVTITSVGDANIRSDQATSNSNGSQLVLVGDTATAAIRGVFSFDLDIPELANATIDSVTLKLFAAGQDGGTTDTNPVTLDVYQLVTGFDETQVTWNVSSTGTNWSTDGGLTSSPGGAYSGTLLASLTTMATGITANQEFSFASSGDNFSGSVSSTLGGDKTLNLLVKLSSEDGTRDIFRFNAGTNSNPANPLAAAAYRPQLVIEYSAIPEPSAFVALAGLGALGFVSSRRRVRR